MCAFWQNVELQELIHSIIANLYAFGSCKPKNFSLQKTLMSISPPPPPPKTCVCKFPNYILDSSKKGLNPLIWWTYLNILCLGAQELKEWEPACDWLLAAKFPASGLVAPCSPAVRCQIVRLLQLESSNARFGRQFFNAEYQCHWNQLADRKRAKFKKLRWWEWCVEDTSF